MTKDTARKPGRAPGNTEDGRPRLDPNIQLRIGEGLRAMYDDIVNQGVPDRFADLLSQLDGQGKGGRAGEDK